MMKRHNVGFTLLELLITLVVIGVLMGLSFPLIQEFRQQQRATQQVNQLLLAIYYTRSEALLRGEVVTLCGSSDGQQCSDGWNQGYLVFSDPNAKGKVENPEQILRYFEPIDTKDEIRWSAFPTDAYLQMAPSGFARDQNGTFYYCPFEGNPLYARAVIVDQAGRARVSRDQNGDGIHENASGEMLVCGS